MSINTKKYDFLVDWFSYNLPFLNDFILKNCNNFSNVLEIGCWEGMSCVYFLENLNIDTITCIDPFYENSYHMFLTKKQIMSLEGKNLNQYERFLNNIKLTGKTEKVNVIRDRSENVLQNLQKSFYDFIFIDGLHSVQQIEQEINMCYPLLKINGYILFDDYDCFPEFTNKINELCNKLNLVTILKYRQLIVQKI